MANPEATLLVAAKAQLIAAATSAGSNIFVARGEPVESAHELPAIVLHAPRTTAEFLARPYIKHRVSVSLIVQCIPNRSASALATSEETSELAAHALENEALLALLAHPQGWCAEIEKIEGYSSESTDIPLAEYVYRARLASLTVRMIADFALSLPETVLEIIGHTYTFGNGDDAPAVVAETETEE